jgi:hypothetical protein
VAAPSVYRRQLIEAGALSVAASRDIAAALGLPILLLDEAGERAARRHIEQGERGAKVMAIPSGLAPWQADALAARERRRPT